MLVDGTCSIPDHNVNGGTPDCGGIVNCLLHRLAKLCLPPRRRRQTQIVAWGRVEQDDINLSRFNRFAKLGKRVLIGPRNFDIVKASSLFVLGSQFVERLNTILVVEKRIKDYVF